MTGILCAACGEGITVLDCLKLGDAHPDLCKARPTLMRIDVGSDGSWMPLVRAAQFLTPPDKDRILKEVRELIAAQNKRARG